MNLIHTNCPKCQQRIEIEAPSRRLILPVVTAFLVGAASLIGVAFIVAKMHRPPARTAWVAPGKTKELMDALPTANAQELADGAAPRSQPGVGTKSLVHFNNKTAQALQLFWLDFNGQRKKYGVIPPFGNYTQATYATHPWLLIDDNSNNVALFVSEPGNCVATINSHP